MKLACLISMFLATACCSGVLAQDVPDSNNFLLGKLESHSGDELVFTYAIGRRVFIQQEHALAGGGTEVRSVPRTVPEIRQQAVSARSRAETVDGRALNLQQLRPGKSVSCVLLKDASASITALQKQIFNKQVLVVWPATSPSEQTRGNDATGTPSASYPDEVMPPTPALDEPDVR